MSTPPWIGNRPYIQCILGRLWRIQLMYRDLRGSLVTLILPFYFLRSICIISPIPVKPGGGETIGFLAVCHSVRPSVRLSVHSVSVHSVFRTFLSRPLGYWLEIWYVNSSWNNTEQVRVSLRLTYFYRSYCPLLKFSFPGFSLPSFEILTWNLVYEFVLTQYRSSLSFVTLDLLL